MPIDYKALVADRKAKQTRPIVRHPICLAPELYADLEEALAEVRHWSLEVTTEEDELTPSPDRRAGGSTPAKRGHAAARKHLDAVEAQIADASVVGVFRAPNAAAQSESLEQMRRDQEAAPEHANTAIIQHAKTLVLDAFDRFEVAGEKIDLDKADLASVLDEWTQGEILGLSSKIQDASVGAPDLPFSVQQSLLKRRSDATSKQP